MIVMIVNDTKIVIIIFIIIIIIIGFWKAELWNKKGYFA